MRECQFTYMAYLACLVAALRLELSYLGLQPRAYPYMLYSLVIPIRVGVESLPNRYVTILPYTTAPVNY